MRPCLLAALAFSLLGGGAVGASPPGAPALEGETTLYLPLVYGGLRAPVLKWQEACPAWGCETGWYASPAVADVDGDAQLEPDVSGVQVPACPSCGGMLKPDVVFFGETVPPQKVRDSYAALEEADAVLVVGSSLAVFSGYRFVRRAAQLGKPIVVVNSGTTRADPLAQLKLAGSCGALLSAAVQLLALEGA